MLDIIMWGATISGIVLVGGAVIEFIRRRDWTNPMICGWFWLGVSGTLSLIRTMLDGAISDNESLHAMLSILGCGAIVMMLAVDVSMVRSLISGARTTKRQIRKDERKEEQTRDEQSKRLWLSGESPVRNLVESKSKETKSHP